MAVVEESVSNLVSDRVKSASSRRRNVTRVGFVGLADAAPFFVAKELGIFERHGLDVLLTREVGWATIREKVLFGELEAAHALCPLPFSATLGVDSKSEPTVSGLILSRGGNAIVLSDELRQRGVRDVNSLKRDIENRRVFRKYIFASVYPCSTHSFVLRDWLSKAGIDPDTEVHLVTLPPSQMCRNLAAGTIDGFCAGDPWASLAISESIGWSPATSVDIQPDHPEKVLMVSERFAETSSEEHIELIASLVEACSICDNQNYRKAIANLMSDRKRVNCSAELLEKCLSPSFDYGFGMERSEPRFIRFFDGNSNRPSMEDASWIIDRMSNCVSDLNSEQREELRSRVFRPDIYEQALKKVDLAAANIDAAKILKA